MLEASAIVLGAVGFAAATVVAPAIVGALGFGSAGVAAGSTAAWAQSTFLGGVIAKGSLFATLQSWGAAGIPIAVKLVTGAAAAAAARLI
ncbi:interferon alpha-inducible protein 27-like protein 2 [Ixodes scapularis]|nr:interferon alpha-inducible protein 27-like protein 2 [Ixodes scapularis]